jgi:hypothetical protein
MKGALLLLAALALGITAGLYYAWGVNPVSYTDTSPGSLRDDFRADYLTLIASAYDATGDIQRARARVALFAYADPGPVLAALAQQRLAQGWPEGEARALARLAADCKARNHSRRAGNDSDSCWIADADAHRHPDPQPGTHANTDLHPWRALQPAGTRAGV